MAASEKSLEAARAAVASLNEQAARADTEKADCDKLVAHVREESGQGMVCLNVSFIGCIQTEKFTRSLVTELVSVVDAVVP